MLDGDQKKIMLWGLSPQELSNETTKEESEASRLCSPKLEDEDSDMYHPFRRCNLVVTQK